MPFVNSAVLVMEKGMTGATGNWYNGLHEEADMAFLLHALRPEDLFVDVGANVGSYTVLASAAVGARSISFEPVASTYARLHRNLVVNEVTERVTAHNIGVGAREETLRFSADDDARNHVVTGDYAGVVTEVPVRRIDDVLDGAVPLIAKIDVEGWETEVLKGMSRTLANPGLKAIITETNDVAARYDDAERAGVSEIMEQHGFQARSYDPFNRRLTVGGTGHNTIFMRDIDLLQERVTAAPTFTLVNGTL